MSSYGWRLVALTQAEIDANARKGRLCQGARGRCSSAARLRARWIVNNGRDRQWQSLLLCGQHAERWARARHATGLDQLDVVLLDDHQVARQLRRAKR